MPDSVAILDMLLGTVNGLYPSNQNQSLNLQL